MVSGPTTFPDSRFQIPNQPLEEHLDKAVYRVILYLRIAESRIRTALHDTRVVAISGPRQSGKAILARRFAKSVSAISIAQ